MISKWETSTTPCANDRGFTLIEVMISMMVITVAILALSSLNVNTWGGIGLSKSYTEASVMASQYLESLFSEKYASDQAAGMSPAVTVGDHNFTSSDGNYQVLYTIRDSDSLPDTKSVQMNVRFSQGAIVKNTRFNYLLPLRK
jgi:prepilin-type N-terminal cleavage/methylation domain-containing protein